LHCNGIVGYAIACCAEILHVDIRTRNHRI
jgi:hypothetical protein